MSDSCRSGTTRDLDVADARHVAFQRHREIAFDDVAVVAIELHLQVRRADLPADRLRVVLAVRKKPGRVSGVLIGSMTIVMASACAVCTRQSGIPSLEAICR
jgi:hypothetical protein